MGRWINMPVLSAKSDRALGECLNNVIDNNFNHGGTGTIRGESGCADPSDCTMDPNTAWANPPSGNLFRADADSAVAAYAALSVYSLWQTYDYSKVSVETCSWGWSGWWPRQTCSYSTRE